MRVDYGRQPRPFRPLLQPADVAAEAVAAGLDAGDGLLATHRVRRDERPFQVQHRQHVRHRGDFVRLVRHRLASANTSRALAA